jgi:hypothetical protein
MRMREGRERSEEDMRMSGPGICLRIHSVPDSTFSSGISTWDIPDPANAMAMTIINWSIRTS